jgi:MarR family transcriptional regulator, transcriptional regulator for hemolysin
MGKQARESSVRSLMRIAKKVRLCMDTALAEKGSSFAIFAILDAITVERGLSQRQIASRLSIEGPPLTRHLERMEADGLVERRRDEHDRRVQRVYLTAAGAKLYDTLCPVVADLENTLLAGVSGRDAATFTWVLSHMQTTMADDEAGEYSESGEA